MRVRAIGERGTPLTRVVGGSGRESITVLATVSADGGYLPPFIVYKGVSVQARWVSPNPYPGTLYSASSNGWMEEPQFFEWFCNGFVHHVTSLRVSKNCPDQKAILLYDGHASHISYRIIKTAMENKIELIKMPSHLTDKIQPLDKCVFGPVKNCWERKLISFGKKQIEKQGNCRISKSEFATLIGEVWKEAMISKNIVSGFTSTGLFPVNACKFPESAFNPQDLANYKRSRALVPMQPNQSIQPTPTNQDLTPVQEHIVDRPTETNIPNVSETPKKTPQQNKRVTPNTPTGIIEIFTTSMIKTHRIAEQTHANPLVKKDRKIPRLKPERYGEVLTTEEVLAKVKETEDKKELENKIKEEKKLQKIKNKGETKKQNLKRKLDFDSKNQKSKKKEDEITKDISDDDLEALKISVMRENTIEVEYEEPSWIKLTPGTFILVDFIGGSRNTTHYKYVCCIQDKDDDDGEIRVAGYRRFDEISTQFIVKDNDVSIINFDQILAILPEPVFKEVDRKVVFEFKGCVSVYEK
ncbi:uncharacterized protein LOC120352824 [Nilaparvata lugens]|uniref:uncharacterized protein LOC120352824 n=1 Tax=Nilaparvata lugens TaxID=108931 RepID=UPI00193E145A|nr:uncharacterized protein LOC120352824 [Nilaparvata lugens]XP_039291041.1 uncharacterized protein LOC120352824 [Nilaparvata lugens]